MKIPITYFRDLEEGFGDLNHIAKWLHVLDPSLHSVCMTSSRRLENIFDLLNLILRPVVVHWTAILEYTVEDGKQAESNNGFFIYHVQLVADRPYGDTSSGGQNRSLRYKRIAGQSVDN